MLYPRLFTGGTTYRYIAGSRSWFEWPLPADLDGWGLDVGVFWLCVFGSAWLLWRSATAIAAWDLCNRVLLAAWANHRGVHADRRSAGNGPRAKSGSPYVWLRRRSSCWPAGRRWPGRPHRRGGAVVLAAATLAGWPLVADFHAHYFRFIERLGGQAHLAFRTAAVEPKQAALQAILAESDGQRWIICRQWWNRWPIRYLALSDRGVRVPDPEEIVRSDDYRRALAEGRVWFVEFCGTEELQQAESQLAHRRPTRWLFLDFGRRPVLCVLHAGAE